MQYPRNRIETRLARVLAFIRSPRTRERFKAFLVASLLYGGAIVIVLALCVLLYILGRQFAAII